MKRRNLVIVRAGNSSLHPGWLQGSRAERSWDLIVNYFGDDPDIYRGGDWQRIDSKGPKWAALHDLIESIRPQIEPYDYIWLPDDDLECSLDDVNRLFEICRNESLVLAQPSLTHDSYFTHAVTLHNRCFQVRNTAFVEIMAPCLSQQALWTVLPSFNANRSGWGLCFLWPQRLLSGARMGIIDAVQVRHTRPIGAANYGAVKAAGRTAFDELEEFLQTHNLRRRYGIASAISRSGRRVPRGLRLLWLYGLGLLEAAPNARAENFPRVWLSAMYQQTKS